MIRKIINYLYWKYVGDFTILGRVNGKGFLLNIKSGRVQRSYLQASGSYENVQAMPGEMTKEKFEHLAGLFEKNIL